MLNHWLIKGAKEEKFNLRKNDGKREKSLPYLKELLLEHNNIGNQLKNRYLHYLWEYLG
jgi:hypothetical protein